MGFTLVASVTAAVTISAVWSVLHDGGVAAVSLRDIAESDILPLGAMTRFRFACAVVAFYTLLCVYCDHEGLALHYRDAQVHLRRCGVSWAAGHPGDAVWLGLPHRGHCTS